MLKSISKLLTILFLLMGIAQAKEEYSEVHAEHILVKTAYEAQQIKKAIDEGGSFEYYAKAYSMCPSGQRGGDLGYFGKGQMFYQRFPAWPSWLQPPTPMLRAPPYPHRPLHRKPWNPLLP